MFKLILYYTWYKFQIIMTTYELFTECLIRLFYEVLFIKMSIEINMLSEKAWSIKQDYLQDNSLISALKTKIFIHSKKTISH